MWSWYNIMLKYKYTDLNNNIANVDPLYAAMSIVCSSYRQWWPIQHSHVVMLEAPFPPLIWEITASLASMTLEPILLSTETWLWQKEESPFTGKQLTPFYLQQLAILSRDLFGIDFSSNFPMQLSRSICSCFVICSSNTWLYLTLHVIHGYILQYMQVASQFETKLNQIDMNL
jgi:hypothetical protein